MRRLELRPFATATLVVVLAGSATSLDAPGVVIQAQAVGDSMHVQLDWAPVPGATSYRVSGRGSGQDPFMPLAEVEDAGWALIRPGPAGWFRVTAESFVPEVLPVPAGTFLMGNNLPGNPIHPVTVTRDFLLARTETTNAEYLEMLNWAWAQGWLSIHHDSYTEADWVYQNGLPLIPVTGIHDEREIMFDAEAGCFVLHTPTLDSNTWGPGFAYPGGYDPAVHPVKFANWLGAAAYCDWLNLRAGLPAHYNVDLYHDPNVHDPYEAPGWRLPTEAEWNRAASFDDGRTFPWGAESASCERVNFRYPAYCVGWSTPVGSYPLGVGALGFQDLGGNVREWCNDFGGPITSDEPQTDPVGPADSGSRAIRNGSWFSFSTGHVRCAWRDFAPPLGGDRYTGFRICRTVQ